MALLRQRLAITDDLAPEHAGGDVFDANLTAAIRRFQSRHGLEETGTVGQRTLAALNVPVSQRLRQLAASLDRLTQMDFTFGQRYVVVNIPAAVAEAVENGKVARRHAVVVGKKDRPSPTLTTHITAVNLNPTWTVPLGILKKDVRTRMRRDPGYIARMHMRVLDGSGREIDPASVNWNSDGAPNYTVRQDSGTFNALGAVRFDMPNPHSVFMHDTNHREHFGTDYRFQSSGCARTENPRDFAVWLLQEQGGWSRAKIDAAIATTQRQDIRLQRKVPVAWVYLTGWVSADNAVHFRDDIYGHDTAPSRALVADAAARRGHRGTRLRLRAAVCRSGRRSSRSRISTASKTGAQAAAEAVRVVFAPYGDHRRDQGDHRARPARRRPASRPAPRRGRAGTRRSCRRYRRSSRRGRPRTSGLPARSA